MADKESTLAIVIKAVDKTTAGLQSVQDSIKSLAASASAPFKVISDKLSAIGKASGITAIASSAMAVASAIKSAFSAVSQTIAGVVSSVLSLVDHFDGLGDKAEKLGVTVDFLAAMRFAAEKSGASIEDLDQGLSTFSVNLGAARAGTGKMVKFLAGVAPELLEQLKATKSTSAAYRILADAMAAIKDPAKRAKLAMATVGSSELAPMLARGSEGLLELQGEFAGLAGSQEAAAEAAGKVDDELKNLGAASQGFKAALVTGVAPALLKIIPLMTEWLSGHREQITQWITDFGARIPGAIDAIGRAISRARDWVAGIIEDLGGWDHVSKSLGSFLRGSFATTLGIISTSMAQIGATVKLLKAAFAASPAGLILENWEPVAAFFRGFADTLSTVASIVERVGGALGGLTERRTDLGGFKAFTDSVMPASPPPARAIQPSALTAALGGAAGARPSEASVKVEFANAPPGTRVTTDPQSTADVQTRVGYQMFFGYGS